MKIPLTSEVPKTLSTSQGEFVIYTTEDNRTEVHLRLIEGTVWMTQADMAELFDVGVSAISKHLKTVYQDGELSRQATVSKMENVAVEQGRSVKRHIEHYNLDAILAVGYRIRGPRGAQFRKWATEVLREYLIKGFALNDDKLKDPLGADYFDELLARIRDIRSSEARLYLELRSIIALADDYEPNSQRTKRLFATIQDKLHYAITGNTAAEIIATRCDPNADNLGLTNWRGTIVRKRDVTTAKNYLTGKELNRLNYLVSGFLNYAQDQAERRKVVHMRDWLIKADQFIEFNDYEPLVDHGRINRKQADEYARQRYELYHQGRNKLEHEDAESELVEALREADRQLIAQRKRLQPRRKGEESVD
ncbi:RhuM family protein [Corynebacterium pilosum]|uniref:Putative DNA-binding protein n=1 Tax=Corynebacterium pilosum TaxID=35756 RepID=A0A376CLF5_9CORY|nr:RhuM family protein [Corynebacterium pilosum]STC69163.1 putative DNA-binding protein [Corynebacterium pilosum]